MPKPGAPESTVAATRVIRPQRPLLILHQYYCPPGGWGNNRSAEFAAYFAQHGVPVVVLTTTAFFPADHPAWRKRVWRARQGLLELRVLRQSPTHQRGYWGRVWRFLRFAAWLLVEGLRCPRPWLIYASSTPLSVPAVGAALSGLRRRPWVFECVDVWPDVPRALGLVRPRWLGPLLQGCTNLLYRSARGIVAWSPGMRQQILRHGVPPGKVLVSYNGTHIQQFRPAPSYPPEPPVVGLHAGSIGYVNGLAEVLAAYAALLGRSDLPDWRLWLVGEGNQRRQVQKRIGELGLEQHVLWRPPQPKERMPALFQQAHYGLMTVRPNPALEANSANKFYDYLAAGLPIVLNYAGWQAQWLELHGAGWWIAQDEQPRLSDVLAQVHGNRAERAQRGARARLSAAEVHRPKLAAELLEQLRQWAPPRPGAPPR